MRLDHLLKSNTPGITLLAGFAMLLYFSNVLFIVEIPFLRKAPWGAVAQVVRAHA